MRPRLELVSLATCMTCMGCQDPADDQLRCPWIEDVVPLDYSLGPWGGDLGFDLTPGKVLDQITIPQRGELTWNGGAGWVDITPDGGTTGFSSVLTYNGTTVYRRVLDADLEALQDRIPPGERVVVDCSPTLELDASIRFVTDDGALDETWQTTLSFALEGRRPSAELDAEALGLPQKLQISKAPDPPTTFYDERYSMSLDYRIDLLSPDEHPPRFGGELKYDGTISEEKIGEIINVSGFRLTLLEWVGSPEGVGPTRRPPG